MVNATEDSVVASQKIMNQYLKKKTVNTTENSVVALPAWYLVGLERNTEGVMSIKTLSFCDS